MTKKLINSLIIATLIFSNFIFSSNISNAEELATKMKGKILLQVEENGEAWYVNPDNESRYFLGRPNDAFRVMREQGLGISNKDFNSYNSKAPKRLAGKIIIKVEDSGKAYYINPDSLEMHYLGKPADAFQVMRKEGLGITNENLKKINIGDLNAILTQMLNNFKDISTLKFDNRLAVHAIEAINGPNEEEVNFQYSSKGALDYRDQNNQKIETKLLLNADYSDGANEKINLSFDVDLKVVDQVLYFKINEIPEFVKEELCGEFGSICDYITESWFYIDDETINSLSGAQSSSNNNETVILQDKLMRAIINSQIFNIKNKLDNEIINGVECYHLKLEINTDNFIKLAKTIIDIMMTDSGFNQADKEEIMMGVIEFSKELSNILTKKSGDVWIGIDDLLLYRYQLNLELDFTKLTNDSENTIININTGADYSDYNTPVNIEKPSTSMSIFELLSQTINSAREKAIDAKRVSNIKITQTALELYYMDAGEYPETITIGEPIEYNGVTYLNTVPGHTASNDGVCSEDFEISYKQTENGQNYELTYCLNESISPYYKSGINIIDNNL